MFDQAFQNAVVLVLKQRSVTNTNIFVEGDDHCVWLQQNGKILGSVVKHRRSRQELITLLVECVAKPEWQVLEEKFEAQLYRILPLATIKRHDTRWEATLVGGPTLEMRRHSEHDSDDTHIGYRWSAHLLNGAAGEVPNLYHSPAEAAKELLQRHGKFVAHLFGYVWTPQ